LSAKGLVPVPGRPEPLGATAEPEGFNFAVRSPRATSFTLVVFSPGEPSPLAEFPLDADRHRTGETWHVLVRGLAAPFEYGFRVGGPGGPLDRFDAGRLLLDPYARVLTGGEVWVRDGAERVLPGRVRPRRSYLFESAARGIDTARPGHSLCDSIIYELHVRGFTRGAGSGVAHPGSYRGVVEKIPHLRELGITTVELMPVAEFDENENVHTDPTTGEPLVNFWGYSPISFFAPKAAYAASKEPGAALGELRSMVEALHAAGIEVIVDVVFNHTAEGDERGPTLSFRGLDNRGYYGIDPETGAYRNDSGVGNTVSCNQPAVQELILEALRFWATGIGVDGFRFDLASILARGTDGELMERPPVLERIAADPVLAGIKLIAEPWDAAGAYQVGAFRRWGAWSEWNGKYRDDLRRFVRGDTAQVMHLASRLSGSSDLYAGGELGPAHGINFVTSHDGFTLADLVSYDRKHNEANGEDDRDGHPENFSWNHGEEGPSDDAQIEQLRRRQMKNFAALLLVSQGVPMILAGDEMGRTQRGNNNAYCQDNEVGWIDWSLLETNRDLFRFFKMMIAFRRRHPILRRREFFADDIDEIDREIHWHGQRPGLPDWSGESRCLAMHLVGGGRDVDLYLIANAHWEERDFDLPAPSAGRWHRFVDTSLAPPNEIVQEEQAPPLITPRSYRTPPRTTIILIAK
jgi:glycogen operon protein